MLICSFTDFIARYFVISFSFLYIF
jgi:hypothetical protein